MNNEVFSFWKKVLSDMPKEKKPGAGGRKRKS